MEEMPQSLGHMLGARCKSKLFIPSAWRGSPYKALPQISDVCITPYKLYKTWLSVKRTLLKFSVAIAKIKRAPEPPIHAKKLLNEDSITVYNTKLWGL